jgi:hypothetical protein
LADVISPLLQFLLQSLARPFAPFSQDLLLDLGKRRLWLF